jgi:hypothetical protein
LIPLKAKAWLNLTGQRDNGEEVDAKNIDKHKNDVFRLCGILTPTVRRMLPESVKKDLREFVIKVTVDPPNLKSLKLPFKDPLEALELLRSVYQIGP